MPEHNAYFTFFTVYGNSEHAGQALTLKIWDASTGNVYPEVETRLRGSLQNLKFAANAIHGDSDNPTIHNALDVVQQTIELGNGWNWVSFNVLGVEPPLFNQVLDHVGNAGKLLKSQSDGYIQRATSWVGDSFMLKANQMYLLQTNTEHSLHVKGEPIKPASSPITLAANGWTWIGYTPQFTLPINSALAGLNPQVGDQIKGHTAYRTYMGSSGWLGNMNYMRPGEGYMYYSKNGSPQTFYYPSATSQYYKVKRQEVPEVDKYWSTNIYKYSDNMTITGYVEINGAAVQSDQIEIGAFVGDECRGSIMLKNYDNQADLPHPYLAFLMIYGDSNQEIHFRVYSHEDGKEYPVQNDPITYVTNQTLGNPEDPYRFILDNLSGIDASKNMMEIYPNPVRNILHINHSYSKIDVAEITDLSGHILFREVDFDKNRINVSSFPNGMYLFKIIVNDESHVYKFMKK
ncbi:MAG: hypothetical protein BGO29_12645 [Bacteroidales bacterium 36-12]|nr:MAG: hypothetical protein BGO29_12645 [Bacteroidales bacterium 36-12]